MPNTELNVDDVPQYIEDHLKKWKFGTHSQTFLPQNHLDRITTKEVIKRLIEKDGSLGFTNRDLPAFVDRVFNKCRVLFAICVACEESLEILKVMVENGLNDKMLPLCKESFYGLKSPRRFVNSFISLQKRFCTKFLAEDDIQQFSDDVSIPIKHEPKSENLKGHGAFGKVWEIEVHPAHRGFPCETNKDDRFAMKVVDRAEPREQNFHNEMKDLQHPHLTKCLMSFTFGPEYHMIYQLASGNLEEFMTTHAKPSKDPEMTDAWLAQQLAGLAGALKVVHNQDSEKSTTKSNVLSVPQHNATKTGFIHDIKPENILIFAFEGKQYWLRLSDFSCAKVIALIETISGNHRESYKTSTKTGTPIYRAPESSMSSETSRPYDMWSLGCVFVEVLVWYTEGFNALEKFRTSRRGLVQRDGLNDEGFYHEVEPASDGKQPRFALRKTVTKAIETLSHRCTGELKSIAKVIPELLEIDPKQRITAARLVEKLKPLGTGTSTAKVALSKTNSNSSRSVPIRGPKTPRAYYPDSDFPGLVVTPATHHEST